MFKRRLVATSIMPSLIVILLASMALTVHAAPRAAPSVAQPASVRIPAAVTETAKVVLPETSIGAPGFFSGTSTFEGQTSTSSVIAWAGTDTAHHLNVMTSTDGLHFAHKITLHQTSLDRPDVVQMSQAAGGAVILAWRGTDPSHLLNVLFDVYGQQKKITLRENSIAAPALTLFNGNLLLAWTGTDANHSLNVMTIPLSSFTPGKTTVLPQFSSAAGPNLANRNGAVVLCWATRANHLNFASSTDAIHFTSALGNGLPQLSTSAPDFLFFHSEGGPENWIVWTGTDPAHHMNMQWTSHYPQWPDPAHTKTVLSETALGGPALEFNAGRIVAWTGTDPAHHLNVARFENF